MYRYFTFQAFAISILFSIFFYTSPPHFSFYRPFLLYIGFLDCHRCPESEFGDFCEKFGNGHPKYGIIPDWKPVYYDPDDVIVPPFLPDTPVSRGDIANQYTAMSRLDAGNVE